MLLGNESGILVDELVNENGNCVNYTSYKDIYHQNDGYASHKWTNYFDVYDAAYQKFIGKSPNVLEIGVQNGGGLENSNKYFLNGNIYGVDINPKVCNLKFSPNIQVFCFDAANKQEFDKNLADINFDIILDDGSHKCSDVINSFNNLFSKVNPGGVYVIEDLHASYWSSHGGGMLKKDSSIEFLKHIIDLLNAYHVKNNFVQKLSNEDLYLVQWVESITFYDSIAYIKKLEEPRNSAHQSIVRGKDRLVAKLKGL